MKRLFRPSLLGCLGLLWSSWCGPLDAQTAEAIDHDRPLPPAGITAPDDARSGLASPDTTPETPPPPEPARSEELIHISDILAIGSTGQVARTEQASDMTVVFGRGVVEGRIRNDLVVVFGSARVDGEIGGDLVAPFSRIELGPAARIRGDLVVVAGSLVADPEARIDGTRLDLSWNRLEGIPGFPVLRNMVAGLGDWFSQALLLGRLLPVSWGWWWWTALALAFGYLLVALLAPRAVLAGATQLETQPVACFFIGILGFLLVNVLLLFLGSTVIGLLAWPFLIMAFLLVQIAGKAALYQSVGHRLGRQLGGNFLAAPLPALIAGLALFTVIYMIPILGLFTWLVVAPLALGAALMALFRSGAPATPHPAPAPITYPTAPTLTEVPTPSESPESSDNLAVPPAPIAGPPPVSHATPPQPRTVGEFASLPRAGFWIRTAATLLDLLVVFLPLVLVNFQEYFPLFWIAYHVALWTWRGTTIGGVICRLKIVRLDGQPLSLPIALVRCLASFLSAAVLLLGFFWVGWTRERLSWHDRIAGTAIVRVPQGIPLL